MLGHLRERSLLATTTEQSQSAEKTFNDFSGSYGADYVVSLLVTASGSQCALTAKWLDVRKAKTLVNVTESVNPDGPDVLPAIARLAQKLVDEAAYFEICAYKGPMKIKVHTTRTKDDRLEYPVFCNGNDQQYVKTTSLITVADTNLDVMRTARAWATGTLHYESSETQKLVEEDPCYQCPSGRKGGRTYTENKRTTRQIDGLSDASSTAGQHFDDIRIYLKFARNGTYTLQLVATTKFGPQAVHIDRKAEGTCDTQLEKPTEDYTIATNFPVAHVMGPFPGQPKDKTLTAHKEFRQKDPLSEEETTINVEFQLRRD
jgi:hypothetical protein